MTTYNPCDDESCDKEITYYFVSQRPSDPSEICATLALCKACGEDEAAGNVQSTFEDVAKTLSEGKVVCATADVLNEYIESLVAARAGHIFLTI